MGHLPLITIIIIISVQVITVCMYYYILYCGLEIHGEVVFTTCKVVKRNHHHKCVVSTSFLIKVIEETRHAPFSRPCVCAFTIPYVKICNTLCLLVIIKAVTSIPVMNDWKQYCCCEPTFQGGCLNSTSVCIYHVQGVIDIEAALKLFIYYI